MVWRCFTISPRPELVKLLALSNFPAFVHFVTCVSQDITASIIVCFFWTLQVIDASFSLIECASCHRYLEPNGFSASILLFRAPLMTRLRNGSLVSDALFRGGLICFRICLIIRSLFWPMIVNVFVAFHERGIVLFALL